MADLEDGQQYPVNATEGQRELGNTPVSTSSFEKYRDTSDNLSDTESQQSNISLYEMAVDNINLREMSNAIDEVAATIDSRRSLDNPRESVDGPHTEEILTPKEAIEIVREFDGKNLSIESFIGEIDEARGLVPNDRQKYLLRLIKAKRITGTAARELEAYSTETYQELFEALRLLYASTQPVEVWQNSRARCFQRRNETVTQYANRFLEVQNKVLNCTINSTEPIDDRRIHAEYERKQGLRQFLLGLRPEYAIQVRSQNPGNIRQAIALAQAAESQQMTREIMMKQAESKPDREHGTRTTTNFKTQDRPSDRNRIVTCNYCKRLGHSEHECRTKKYHEERAKQTRNFREDSVQKNPPGRIHEIQDDDPQDPLEYTPLETVEEQ